MDRKEFLSWALPLHNAVRTLVIYAPGGIRARRDIEKAAKVLAEIIKAEETKDGQTT